MIDYFTLHYITVHRADGDYIDCYTLASHGRVQTRHWVHHYDDDIPPAASSGTELPCWHSKTDSSDSLLMMRLVRDMVFVQVDSVPECVCQPPQSCLKFVVSPQDVDGMLESAVAHWTETRDSHHNDLTYSTHTWTTHTCPGDDVPAPPLPPKPLHLSLTVSTRSQRQCVGGLTRQETELEDNWQHSCEQQPSSLTHCQVSSAVMPRDASSVTDNSPAIDNIPHDVTDNNPPQVAASEDFNSSIREENAEEVNTFADDIGENDVAVMNIQTVTVRPVNKSSSDVKLNNLTTTKLTDGCDVVTQCSQSSSSLSLTSLDSDEVLADKAGTPTVTSVSRNSADDRPRRMSAPASQQHYVIDSRHCVDDSTVSPVDQRSHEHSLVDPVAYDDKQRECNAGVPASNIEKQYSLVKKKKSDHEQGLAASAETASLEPNESEKMTHEVTSFTQTESHVNNQQPNAHFCSFPFPAASVQPPSTMLFDVEAPSLSLAQSASRRQDMVTGNRVSPSYLGAEWSLCGGSTDVEHRLRRLNQGSLLLAHQSPVITSHGHRVADSELDRFVGTLMAYDGQGCVFYVPVGDIMVHGDPAGEAWFFPVPLTALQATILLSSKQVVIFYGIDTVGWVAERASD